MEEIRKFQHAGMIEIAIYLQNRKQPATFTEISKGVNLNSETVRRVIDTFIKMGIAIEIVYFNKPYYNMEPAKPQIGLKMSLFLPDIYNYWIGIFTQAQLTQRAIPVKKYYSERLGIWFDEIRVMPVSKGDLKLVSIMFVRRQQQKQVAYLQGLEDAFNLTLDEAKSENCSVKFRGKILQLALFSEATLSQTLHGKKQNLK